jgi:hypothetical protein
MGAARLNLKKVRDTDAAAKTRPERENRIHIGIKGFTPPNWQPVRPEEERQLPFMLPMPHPEESDSSAGAMAGNVNGNNLNHVPRFCGEQNVRGNAQAEANGVRVQEVYLVDVPEKRH